MTRSLKKLWARLQFRDRGILPTRKLLILFLLWSAVIGILFTFGWLSWISVFVVNGMFLLATLFDLLLSPRASQLVCTRKMPEEMERNRRYTVEIVMENRSRPSRPVYIQLKDDVPQSFLVHFPVEGWGNPSIHSESADAVETDVFAYDVRAPVRGRYAINKVHIRYRSTLGLWQKQTMAPVEDTVKVIPDLSEAKRYLESAQRFLLHEGVKIRRQHVGTGEFAQIRKYAVGDDPRKINWRQTAKLQEVMTNEYEPEHGKYITILIDCGRMMGAELATGNRLEKAMEAALTTATAALKNNDHVAVIAFSKNIKAYVPPDKGMDHLQKIVQAIYDLEVDPYESNYPLVMGYVQTVQKKRSLLLLFSDIHAFLHEETALVYMRRLRQRHIFLMIGIEDSELLEVAGQAPDNVGKAMEKSVAQDQIQLKKQEKTKWEARGLLLAEAKEEHLATEAVSRYIHIMNQGLL